MDDASLCRLTTQSPSLFILKKATAAHQAGCHIQHAFPLATISGEPAFRTRVQMSSGGQFRRQTINSMTGTLEEINCVALLSRKSLMQVRKLGYPTTKKSFFFSLFFV